MDWIKRSPFFFAWLACCALAGAGGLYRWQQLRVTARREMAVLGQKKEERDRLALENPAPSDQNLHAIEADLAKAEQNLAALWAALQDRHEPLQYLVPPARPIDGYFEIATFVEHLRALAARLQVATKPDEHFGFAAYANEGPDVGLLPATNRQRQAVQHLVETLLAARPRELLAVQRERPFDGASRTGPPAPAAKSLPRLEPAADYFIPDRRLVLRMPGLLDAWMFRFVFTGQTPSLRAFLNGVAASPLPLVVRSVQVEPLVHGQEKVTSAAAPADASVPLIAQNFSKFTVVVELAEPVVSRNTSRP